MRMKTYFHFIPILGCLFQTIIKNEFPDWQLHDYR